jgi:hypothetical protein
MTEFSYTSLVVNSGQSKQLGVPSYYYRKRGCNTNLTGNSPAEQYQKLKLIQNSVKIDGSLYISNLGPLSAYKQSINNPNNGLYGVNWNQMSDRPIPSYQKAYIPTGYNTSMNRKHTSVTSSRPGCQTPGGIGCDIKHNSYDRYLNRLKAKGPLRRGPIPPNFGAPISFNQALPIYGGKTTKTNIITGCNCPINSKDINVNNNKYNFEYPSAKYAFNVGDYVYAIENGNTFYSKAIVLEVNGNTYTIQFNDGNTQTENINKLKIYFPCNCNIPSKQFNLSFGADFEINCIIPIQSLL